MPLARTAAAEGYGKRAARAHRHTHLGRSPARVGEDEWRGLGAAAGEAVGWPAEGERARGTTRPGLPLESRAAPSLDGARTPPSRRSWTSRRPPPLCQGRLGAFRTLGARGMHARCRRTLQSRTLPRGLHRRRRQRGGAGGQAPSMAPGSPSAEAGRLCTEKRSAARDHRHPHGVGFPDHQAHCVGCEQVGDRRPLALPAR